MGSFGEGNHSKGDNPAMAWVQRHIEQHNEACRRRAAAVPRRYKLLAALGMPNRYYRWQRMESLRLYYRNES
jgi:hypothetical protein